MDSATGRQRCPVLLCYDGSDAATRAIERARRLIGGGEAIVLAAWESLGSAILRNLPSGGSEARGIAEDVVDELDAGTADAAEATAADGAALASRIAPLMATSGALPVDPDMASVRRPRQRFPRPSQSGIADIRFPGSGAVRRPDVR